MNTELQGTGRTKRMLLKVASCALEPEGNVIFVIAHNMHMARSMQNDLYDIFMSMHLSQELEEHQAYRIKMFSSVIYFGTSRTVMNNKCYKINGRFDKNVKVFYDHYVREHQYHLEMDRYVNDLLKWKSQKPIKPMDPDDVPIKSWMSGLDAPRCKISDFDWDVPISKKPIFTFQVPDKPTPAPKPPEKRAIKEDISTSEFCGMLRELGIDVKKIMSWIKKTK